MGLRVSAIASPFVGDDVAGDGIEPGLEGGLPPFTLLAELRKRGERLQEHPFGDVLCGVRVTGLVKREARDRATYFRYSCSKAPPSRLAASTAGRSESNGTTTAADSLGPLPFQNTEEV